MFKRVLLSSVILFFISCDNGLKDNTKEISIKDTAMSFLIEQGELKKNPETNKYYENILIKELANDIPIDNNNDGVYRLGTFKSHSKEYVLFKYNNDISINETDSLSACIESLYDFFNSQNLKKNAKTIYIEKIIELNKSNIDNRIMIPKNGN